MHVCGNQSLSNRKHTFIDESSSMICLHWIRAVRAPRYGGNGFRLHLMQLHPGESVESRCFSPIVDEYARYARVKSHHNSLNSILSFEERCLHAAMPGHDRVYCCRQHEQTTLTNNFAHICFL